MRTVTTVNWVRSKKIDHMGYLRATVHTGTRAGWTYRIETLSGGKPRLTAAHKDGRRAVSDHATVNQAKAAALALLRPAEAMAWNACNDVTRYRAVWDDLTFVVYQPADVMYFQWRDASEAEPNGFRSEPVSVSGIREAREMARAVLRERYPAETPDAASQAAGEPLTDVNAMEAALMAAGIEYTTDQLLKAAQTLALWNAEDRPYE